MRGIRLLNLTKAVKGSCDTLRSIKNQARKGNLGLVFSGAGIAFLTQAAGFALGYVSNILFARWMGLMQYGIFTYISTWILLLATLAALELPTTLLRFIPAYMADKNWPCLYGIIRKSRLLSAITGVSMALLGSCLAFYLYTYNLSPYAVPLAVGVWMIPLWALVYLHTAMGRAFQKVAISYIPPRVLKPIMLVLFAFLFVSTGRELTGASLLAGSGISLSVILLIQWRCLSKTPSPRKADAETKYRTREWLQVSLGVLMITGVFLLLQQTNTLIIGFWLPPDQVGIYNAAAKTTQLMDMPGMAMAALSVPLFSSLFAKGDRRELQALLSKVVRWSFWPSVFGAVLLIRFSDFFLGLFGPGFVAARPAAVILIFGGLISAAGGPVLLLLQVTGKHFEAAIAVGCSAASGIVLSLTGIYFFGIAGAAWATVLTTLTWVIWLNFLAIKLLGVSPSILYALTKNKG